MDPEEIPNDQRFNYRPLRRSVDESTAGEIVNLIQHSPEYEYAPLSHDDVHVLHVREKDGRTIGFIPISSPPVSSTPVPTSPDSCPPVSSPTISDFLMPNPRMSNSSMSNSPMSNLPMSNLLTSDSLISKIPMSNTPISNTPISKPPMSNLLMPNPPMSGPSISAPLGGSTSSAALPVYTYPASSPLIATPPVSTLPVSAPLAASRSGAVSHDFSHDSSSDGNNERSPGHRISPKAPDSTPAVSATLPTQKSACRLCWSVLRPRPPSIDLQGHVFCLPCILNAICRNRASSIPRFACPCCMATYLDFLHMDDYNKVFEHWPWFRHPKLNRASIRELQLWDDMMKLLFIGLTSNCEATVDRALEWAKLEFAACGYKPETANA